MWIHVYAQLNTEWWRVWHLSTKGGIFHRSYTFDYCTKRTTPQFTAQSLCIKKRCKHGFGSFFFFFFFFIYLLLSYHLMLIFWHLKPGSLIFLHWKQTKDLIHCFFYIYCSFATQCLLIYVYFVIKYSVRLAVLRVNLIYELLAYVISLHIAEHMKNEQDCWALKNKKIKKLHLATQCKPTT